MSFNHSFRILKVLQNSCIFSDVIINAHLFELVLRCARNLQEDLESQLDLGALFHLSVPEDLQDLVPQ
jgi:hypothetical protein